MPITIRAVGIEKVIVKLDKLESACKNLSPAFEDMSGVIIQEFKANFPAAGANLDAPWVPRKRSYPWPIFVKTGRMKESWDGEPSKDKLKIKNTTEYASYHHFGMWPQPVRLLVNSSKKIVKIIQERITKYLKTFF